LTEMLRVHLWPYYTPSLSAIDNVDIESGDYKTTTELNFKQGLPAFDLEIVRPSEKVFFQNVRIINPYSLFFPLTAARNNAPLSISKVVSGSVTSAKSCMINGIDLIRFNGASLSMHSLTTNLHLPITISSSYPRFKIMAAQDQEGVWQTLIRLVQRPITHMIKIKPSGSHALVELNGQRHNMMAGSKCLREQSDHGDVMVELCMTSDNVVLVKAPMFALETVRTNGYMIEVIPSSQATRLGGACGRLQSTRGHCIYPKPEQEIASWTTQPNSASSSVSQPTKKTNVCSTVTVQPTKVAKAYKAATGKCTILRHLVQTQPGKVCVSQVPITQCGPSCKPKNPGMTLKEVPFTCMPQGRLAEHYLQKVNEGHGLPELATKEASFTAQVRMPSHCVHALVSPARGI